LTVVSDCQVPRKFDFGSDEMGRRSQLLFRLRGGTRYDQARGNCHNQKDDDKLDKCESGSGTRSANAFISSFVMPIRFHASIPRLHFSLTGLVVP